MSESTRNKVSIGLEQYGDSGWSWTATYRDFSGTIRSDEFRTNGEGEGLWACGSYRGQRAHNYEDKQILGTCQFSLPKQRKAAYAKIRRWSLPALAEENLR